MLRSRFSAELMSKSVTGLPLSPCVSVTRLGAFPPRGRNSVFAGRPKFWWGGWAPWGGFWRLADLLSKD